MPGARKSRALRQNCLDLPEVPYIHYNSEAVGCSEFGFTVRWRSWLLFDLHPCGLRILSPRKSSSCAGMPQRGKRLGRGLQGENRKSQMAIPASWQEVVVLDSAEQGDPGRKPCERSALEVFLLSPGSRAWPPAYCEVLRILDIKWC